MRAKRFGVGDASQVPASMGWCAAASIWNPLALAICGPVGVYNAYGAYQQLSEEAADAYSQYRYSSVFETPIPKAPAPHTSIDPMTGAVVLETPGEMQARYREELRGFFGGPAFGGSGNEGSGNEMKSPSTGTWILLGGVCVGIVLLAR